ncbi:DUF6223 family protein [Nonomuraea sp. NPDC048882]|uniref:DUF6223 family protein n=1 Tax=Nonomuraea sp. NPDC048882 TaxID=3154347 RepID=UPI0033E88CA3
MSVRVLSSVADVFGAVGPAAQEAAHVLVEPVGAYAMTAGRLWSVVGALVGLAGVVVGGLALARSVRRVGHGGRRGAVVALVAGLVGAGIGGMVVAAAEGGPGTGYGIVGGYVALVVGVVAMVLGGLVATRSRRTA